MAVLNLEDVSGQINIKKALIAGNQKVSHKNNIVNMAEINHESLEKHEVVEKFNLFYTFKLFIHIQSIYFNQTFLL